MYTLHIANKRYSSWSMRPWVLLHALSIPFDEKLHYFESGYRQPTFLQFSPTGKVPCLQDQTLSTTIWDSLAIAEYLAESHETVWPRERSARAWARCASAEMHSGFAVIRDECSMNVALRIEMPKPLSDGLQRDLDRLSDLFSDGLQKFGGDWLAGSDFTAVDAMFAPVASRCETYGLELKDPAAQAYVMRLLHHPSVQAWIQQGLKETVREATHEEDCVRGREVLQDLAA